MVWTGVYVGRRRLYHFGHQRSDLAWDSYKHVKKSMKIAKMRLELVLQPCILAIFSITTVSSLHVGRYT